MRKEDVLKIGYGRSRVIWYVILGGAVGAILVPVFAAGMAILAWRENSLYQWGNRMDQARKRVNELMMSATAPKSLTPSFEDPSLDTCWKRLSCDKEDCPTYGLEHARCWLIAGTFCRGQAQGKFAPKLKDCRLCEVYQAATGDPAQEITENFYFMGYLLSEREEQLEKAYEDARNRSEKLAGLVSLPAAALSSVHLSERRIRSLSPRTAWRSPSRMPNSRGNWGATVSSSSSWQR